METLLSSGHSPETFYKTDEAVHGNVTVFLARRDDATAESVTH